MPKKNCLPGVPQVTDPITDQEIAFAHLILSRTKPALSIPIKPEALNRVPAATGMIFDAVLDRANPIRLSFSPNGRFSGRRR